MMVLKTMMVMVIYIYNRRVSVTKNDHFAQLSQINFYLYFQVGFHGFSWFFMVQGWFFMVFHGFSWFQVDFSWFFMVPGWFFMVYVGINGFSGSQVGFSWF